MNDFYYDILNIRKQNKNLQEIISCIIQEIHMEYSISKSVDGLCKVCSLLLYDKLQQLGIESVVLNTQKLMGGGYEHEALLVRSKSNGVLTYYLVDMTFSQFLDNGGRLRDSFCEWPVNALLERDEYYSEFAQNLLERGFSTVTHSQLTTYFSCINQMNGTDFLIEDLDTFFLEQKFRKF